MLRDKSLVPLSHQHQHALALCVRLDRAIQVGEVDLEAWQAEIQQIFEQEVRIHFAAEEKVLFPVAERIPDVKPLVEDLLAEHAALQDLFARSAARGLQREDLSSFVETLSQHIRKEERQLFEGLQKAMNPSELAVVGKALDEALRAVTKTCALPNPATRTPSRS
ncbi:MAG: hemerythrin domain-containing protein [Acidobacteriia bacterium]|nr:hemerythrin domain-containing protein [Terriglobia bacterium]